MRRENLLIKYAPSIIGVLLLVLVLSIFLVRVTRIEAGHVGVEINLAGKQRGRLKSP